MSSPFNYAYVDSNKVYRRKHGFEYAALIGENNYQITVPYSKALINEIEIFNCQVGESIDFVVHDDVNGTISGTPELALNQLGFSVCMSDSSYTDRSNYPAMVYSGMILKIKYHSLAVKSIYFNLTFHQMVEQ